MEGVGSRLGRASARYGSTTVFTGPVRKWKKQWVQVSSSSSTLSYQNSSQSNGNGNGNASPLLLCRWTPISPADSDKSSGHRNEPRKRKFRYTPIVVLEEQKKEAARKKEDASKIIKTGQPTATPISKNDGSYEDPNIDNPILEEKQASSESDMASQDLEKSNLDLSLCLKSPKKNKDSDGGNNQAQLGILSSGVI